MRKEIDLLRRQIEDLTAENLRLRQEREAARQMDFIAALHQSEEKFQLAFHTSPDSINFNRLSDGLYIDVNEGFTKLTGYAREETIGKSSLDLNIWCDPEDRKRLVAGLMNGGYAENFEAKFRRKNGQVGIGLMSARILTLNDEKLILSITRDITERKKMDEALRKSEEQYRAIFENAVEGFFQSTPDGRFIRVNKSFARMCGYASPEEMISAISDIGEQHYEFKKDRDLFAAILNEKGVVENFEHKSLRKDGSTFWVSVSARAVKDNENRILYYEGSHVDIEDRKKAENRLIDAEVQYRSLFDTSTNAILIRDRAGVITMVNEAAIALLAAQNQGDLIGRSYLDLVHPEDRLLSAKRIEKIFHVAVEQRNPTPFEADSIRPREHRMINLKGDIIDVESTGVAFQYKGQFFIQGIFQDITARKQAEEKLKETEKKYRELAESLPQVIFEVDSEGNLIYLNRTGYELFGYTPEDFAGGFNVLEAFVPEDRERIARDILLNVQGQKVGRQEYTAFKKTGASFPVAVHANRVLRDQTATGVRGILIDLTPIRHAEDEKKRLEVQLQQAQKMEAIGALAGGIAHDFNNILSAIIGYTELAMLNEGAEHCAVELKEALTAANRAKDLVKQILAFSRQTDEDRMPVRVGLVAKEAVKFLRATIPSTIEIKARIDEKSGAVLANAVELHQIIMNLCTNAQHAIGDQAGLLEVEVKNTEIDLAQRNDLIDLEIGSYVRTSVRDTGYGMTPDVVKRIFDPYFTTKEKGVGTGLGLAVVHGIVKKYGGAIKVESEAGKGTTFHIYLPKADITAPIRTEPPLSITGGSEKILFVDDEKMLVAIGQQTLQRLGYEVVSRTSPIEALELFKAKPDHFDLVITDQTMPGMTGDGLARELMNIRPALPVIICTGYSQSIDQERAKQIGVKAFVMKPILINEIAAAVRKALDPESPQR